MHVYTLHLSLSSIETKNCYSEKLEAHTTVFLHFAGSSSKEHAVHMDNTETYHVILQTNYLSLPRKDYHCSQGCQEEGQRGHFALDPRV